MYDTDLGYTSEAAAAVEVRSDINDCGRADRPRSDQTGAREEARVTRMLSVSGLTKEEGQMAMMSQNVIRPSTMGTVGEEDSVVNSRVGHLPDDDGLACRSRRAMCKQEVLACRSRRLICKQDVEMEGRVDVVEKMELEGNW